MYCKFCGAELKDDVKFCTKCGKNTIEAFSVEEDSYISKSNKLIKALLPVLLLLLIFILGVVVKNMSTKDDPEIVEEIVEEIAEDNVNEENEEYSVVEKEDSIALTTEPSEEIVNDEVYQLRFNYGVGENDSTPKIMGFDFEIDGKWISTEDLTCGYQDERLYREVTRDNRPGNKNKIEYVELSPEHLKEVRSIFIEAYNTFFEEYEDKFYEVAKDIDVYIVEINEGCPGEFQINIDGKCVNFMVEKFSQGHWSDYGSGNEDEHTYTVGFDIYARVDGLSDFISYIENLIIEDEDKEFSYEEYGIVDNTIQVDMDEAAIADNPGSDIDSDDETSYASIIGTWYSMSDATVITFDENGNYTRNNPNTGEHISLPYYNAGGNRYTVYCEDYYDIDYYLNGDTLDGEEGIYKRE